MKKRQWTGKQKLQIVLEGLRGTTPLGELCAKYEIGQAQFYVWRDMLLKNGEKAFELKTADKQRAVLEKRLAKMQSVIGELTMELKKSEYAL